MIREDYVGVVETSGLRPVARLARLEGMPPVKAALRTGCAGESCEYS